MHISYLTVFQIDISDKDDNVLQSLNIELISLTFEESHFSISGRDNNDEHLRNNPSIFLTFEAFQFEISGNDDNFSQ